MKQKALDRAAGALQKMAKVDPELKRPERPTKEELNKRFVLRIDRSGEVAVKEVS